MNNYILSICIPVFNKVNFTKACLNDLMHLPEDHEIIVVDNGSMDETQEELKKFPRVKVIRNEINGGFAKACNQAYSESNAPNIMFLNNDVKVESNHTDWTRPILEQVHIHNLIGPTGGYIDPANNFEFKYETNDPTKKINYMSGWCLTASRTVWSQFYIPREGTYAGHGPCTQIFSEEFFCYYEDADLGLRSQRTESRYGQQLKIGFKIVDIPVKHFGRVSSRQLNTNALYNKAKQIFNNKWNSQK